MLPIAAGSPGTPDDSGWLYLLSRIVVDARESGELTELAVQAENVSPWAWHALAWRELAAGRFAAAGEANRHSLVLQPDNEVFASIKADLLAAITAIYVGARDGRFLRSRGEAGHARQPETRGRSRRRHRRGADG